MSGYGEFLAAQAIKEHEMEQARLAQVESEVVGGRPKMASTVHAAYCSAVDAAMLLDRALALLRTMEDTAPLIVLAEDAREDLARFTKRMDVESHWLRWKERKQLLGQWRGDAQEPDLTRCPVCGGDADNGHDRCFPPNPYVCTKCEAKAQGAAE